MTTVSVETQKLSGHVITDEVIVDMRKQLDRYEEQFGYSSVTMFADPATRDAMLTGDRDLLNWQALYGRYLSATRMSARDK